MKLIFPYLGLRLVYSVAKHLSCGGIFNDHFYLHIYCWVWRWKNHWKIAQCFDAVMKIKNLTFVFDHYVLFKLQSHSSLKRETRTVHQSARQSRFLLQCPARFRHVWWRNDSTTLTYKHGRSFQQDFPPSLQHYPFEEIDQNMFFFKSMNSFVNSELKASKSY